MDISKFNKELAYQVSKANGLEKHNKIKEAIEIWLNVSEMALKMSKTPNLEFSYKSMLMEKTEQIIAHIKDLKLRVSDKKKIPPIPAKVANSNLTYLDEEEEIKKVDSEVKKSSIPEVLDKDDEIKIIKNSDIKNLPIGFKEIKPLKDFKIVTPHNENYVKEMLKKDLDMSIFNPDKSKEKTNPRIEFEQPKNKDKIICFACGTEIALKSLKCPNCGAEIGK